jgi:hypothetical protein
MAVVPATRTSRTLIRFSQPGTSTGSHSSGPPLRRALQAMPGATLSAPRPMILTAPGRAALHQGTLSAMACYILVFAGVKVVSH